MNFLDRLRLPKKEITSSKDFDTSLSSYKSFAFLENTQLNKFACGLLEGCDALYTRAYKETGSAKFTTNVDGSNMYKMINGFDEYTYLAAFEVMLCSMFGWNEDIAGSNLKFGQDTLFDENGFVVKYLKESPLYERKFSKDSHGNYNLSAGICQFLYQSPIGNFIIKQNQTNNKIYAVYVSEDISELLLSKLTRALEISLDIVPEALEKDFHRKYIAKSDSAKLDEQIKHTLPPTLKGPTVEDDKDEY